MAHDPGSDFAAAEMSHDKSWVGPRPRHLLDNGEEEISAAGPVAG